LADLKYAVEHYLASLLQSGVSSIPRPEPQNAEPQNAEPQNAEPQKVASQKAEPQKVASQKPESTSESVTRDEPTTVRETDSQGIAESTSDTPTTSFSESVDMNVKKRRRKAGSTEQLAVIEKEVSGCTKCPHLAETRTQTVFGIGSAKPRICFVGEAPGAEEDKQGIPFVGRAGQLLDKIMEACKMDRDQVYILNTIKCRPRSNQNPSEEEIDNCWGYAIRQLQVLQPDFICCLGGVAAQTVLKTKTPIGKLRGQFHDFEGIKVMVTYHPAYLLRNPNAKKLVWDDMKKLMGEMGTPLE